MSRRRFWQGARDFEELQNLLWGEWGLFDAREPDPGISWSRTPLAFLDVETTGLDPEGGDRIVEIAIERVDPESGEQRFIEILDPGRPISPEIRRIHAIRAAQTRRARAFADAAPQFLPLLRGAVWVGHNLNFDVRFIRAECRRAGLRLEPAWIVDTWLLSHRLCELPSHSLEAVARHLGHGGRNLHQALDDILTTRAVLASLAARIEPSPRTLRDLLETMVPSREGS